MKPDLIRHPANDEALAALAAAWLVERDAGLTAAEAAAFAAWRGADPRHEDAVRRLERTWGELERLRGFRPEARRHPDPDVLIRRGAAVRPARWPGWVVGSALAAALLVAAVSWWPAAPWRTPLAPAAASETYATTADGYQRVTLADHSVLELNANSAARVEFTSGERRVRLERGEAHFTVAKDRQRPFLVRAEAVTVRAVGTEFNVRLLDRRVELLVTEGRVRVERAPAVAPREPLELGAGERVLLAADPVAAPPVETVPVAAMQEALVWQGPRLRFVETPLAEVIAQFNQRNQVQLRLADTSLAALTVDGSFRVEQVEAFVRLLESNAALRADRTIPGVIVLHATRQP